MNTPTYRLLGGPGSPYSMKLRAALCYRRLQHVWIVPTGYINKGGELEKGGEKTIESAWRAPNEPPPAAMSRLLQLVVAVYLPAAKAHLLAVLKGQEHVNTDCMGMPYESVTNSYTANCLLWIKDEYAHLKPNKQDRVANMLGDGVAAEYLHFLPGEVARLAPHIPV